MLGAAIAGGHAALVGPIVRLCGAAAGTLWTIATWPTIVGDTYRASLEIQARLGGAGMLGLYSMAADIAARILAQGGSVSLLHPVDSVGQEITCGMAAFLILLGMGVDDILVLLAQVEFLLGTAEAPLLLPGLAFGLTSQIGWGAVYALVRGALDRHRGGGRHHGAGLRGRPAPRRTRPDRAPRRRGGPVLSGRDDPRAVAEAVFRERLGPVLALAERHPDATDV